MKRWTLRSVLFLVLGCVTTVAVAWGIAFWLDHAGQKVKISEVVLRDHGLVWDVARNDGVGTTSVVVRTFTPDAFDKSLWREATNFGRGLPHWVELSSRYVDRDGDDPTYVLYRACGWPVRCLVSAQVRGGRLYAADPVNAIVVHDAGAFMWPVLLPLRPIWPGFVINTLFYGAIWFGIFFGFGSARRAIRKRRGRCPTCNYDLRGELDKGCSECGWNRAEDDA